MRQEGVVVRATISLERDVPLFLQEQEAQRSKEVGPQDFDLQVQDMSKVRPAQVYRRRVALPWSVLALPQVDW